MPRIEGSSLEDWDLKGTEIVVAHSPVAGNDRSLDWGGRFAFSQDGRGRVGAAQGKVAGDGRRFNSRNAADTLHHPAIEIRQALSGKLRWRGDAEGKDVRGNEAEFNVS